MSNEKEKIDPKDVLLFAHAARLSDWFLIGRKNGEIIIDSETIETLEVLCLTISFVSRSLIACNIFSEELCLSAAKEKIECELVGSDIHKIMSESMLTAKSVIIKSIEKDINFTKSDKATNLVDDIVKEVVNDFLNESKSK